MAASEEMAASAEKVASEEMAAAAPAASVALWADSTYAYLVELDESAVRRLAERAGFPLASFTCAHGAGLATRGLHASHDTYDVAETVVVEMGYNDEGFDTTTLAKDAAKRSQAKRKMCTQSWYITLLRESPRVRHVLFVAQPGYRQAAQNTSRCEWGKLIDGSALTSVAAELVAEATRIETHVLDVPAEEMYIGFVRHDGALWQDATKCVAYKDKSGVPCSKDGQPSLWVDAIHPSAEGAAAHLKLLLAAVARTGVAEQSSQGALPPVSAPLEKPF